MRMNKTEKLNLKKDDWIRYEPMLIPDPVVVSRKFSEVVLGTVS